MRDDTFKIFKIEDNGLKILKKKVRKLIIFINKIDNYNKYESHGNPKKSKNKDKRRKISSASTVFFDRQISLVLLSISFSHLRHVGVKELLPSSFPLLRVRKST